MWAHNVLLVVVATLAMMASSAATVPFTNCGSSSDTVAIQHMSMNGQVSAGQTLNITATAKSSAAITSGTFSMQVMFLGVTLVTKTGSICNSTNLHTHCPLPAGGFSMHGLLALPTSLPDGTYTVQIQATARSQTPLFCVSLSLSVGRSNPDHFGAWRSQFNVQYTSDAEAKHRRGVFERNLAMITKHNAGEASYSMALNQWADQTFEEWAKQVGNPTISSASENERRLGGTPDQRAPPSPSATNNLPASVNWKAKGVFGPIRNDGVCGCAWSFSVTDTISALLSIQSGTKPVQLSPQELVDCTQVHPWGLNGCHGGWPQLAYTYIGMNGACTEQSYPYHASAGQCQSNCTTSVPPATVSYAALLPTEEAFMERVSQQPVMTAVGVVPGLQFYKSGVFDGSCEVAFSHCLVVAGYGTTAGGQDFWYIRNNWGTGWGESGYGRIARGVKYPAPIAGQCDILGLGLYPTIASSS